MGQSELEFLKSLWGLGTEEEEGYSTGPPGYIGWWNSFLGIDSWAPYTFKNTGSGSLIGVTCTDIHEDLLFFGEDNCFTSPHFTKLIT
jgi:hypothetical protein